VVDGVEMRRARPDEADALRELIIRSMAHWRHSDAVLDRARRLVSIGPDDLARDEAWVLEVRGTVGGFYRMTFHAGRAEIEELFLEPDWIGQGLGRRLFEDAVARARERGARRLTWDSDVQAAGFYRAMGGVPIGTTPSSIEETGPLMRMELRLDR
jgi:GNAT superfamily N-acetyltransferase